MSDENKEKNLPETPDNEKEKVDGDWKWDAAVPETKIDGITIDDLSLNMDKEKSAKEVKQEENEPENKEDGEIPVENLKAEKKENKKPEKKAKKEETPKKDDECCVICGRPRRNSGSDLYCIDCSRKYIRTHFGIPQIILAFLMVFFAAFGYILCVSNVQVSTHLSQAEKYLSEKRYADAGNEIVEYSEKVTELDMGLNSFLDFFNSDPSAKDVDFFKDGNYSIRIMLDAYIHSFNFDDNHITSYINFVKAEFKDGIPESKEYDEIRKMYNFCLDVKAYMNGMQSTWYSFIYTDEETTQQKIKYDEAIAFLDKQPNDTLAQKASNGFFRLVAETFAETDKERHYAILDQLYKDLGDYGYIFDDTHVQIAWSYEDYDRCIEVGDRMYARNINDTTGYYYAIRANIVKGDLQAADERCERMLQDNPENLNYYTVKAEVLRRQGKFNDSVEICKKGIAIGMDAQIYNQQAISYMLLDDKAAALEAAKNSYEVAMQTISDEEVALEIINTTALITFLCGDSEYYEQIVEFCEQLEYDLEDSVNKCIKGEITFEQIYMEGEGDV